MNIQKYEPAAQWFFSLFFLFTFLAFMPSVANVLLFCFLGIAICPPLYDTLDKKYEFSNNSKYLTRVVVVVFFVTMLVRLGQVF